MRILREWIHRLWGTLLPGRRDGDLEQELRLHLEMAAEDARRRGLDPADAARAARIKAGGASQAMDALRDQRGLPWLDGFVLDCKLGLRMLVKYPGLTLVGGLGMAVGVAIGATSFAFLYASLHPTLPLHEGERVVGLENWDTSRNNQEERILHDFVAWRDELKSVQELSAFRMISRNVIVADERAEQASVAEMTASGFRVARVGPLLGRYLVDDDEREGAPPVIVIGYDVWRTRFASDPHVVGKSVWLGSAMHTVVGVMPEGFAFPINHRLWVPLRANASDYERRRGPSITIFGRLAPGVGLDGAQAELTAIGQRAAADFPKTHQRLRPRVVRYTELWFDDGPRAEMHIVQFLVTMLLVVICVNVSVLVYARTAMREADIAVRTALGASRRRIVAQLFTEGLVLSLAAAAAGLILAGVTLRQANVIAHRLAAQFELGGIPFWMKFELSAGTVLYTLALAVVGALIVGVLPAIKATGGLLEPGVQHLASGCGLRLGKTWTVLIVVQVAFAVAVLPGALFFASQSIRLASSDPGFAAEAFLTARVMMDVNDAPTAEADAYGREFRALYADRVTELVRRLEAEPGVSDVTVSSVVPGGEHQDSIEIHAGSQPQGSARHRVRVLHVDVDFFDAFDVPVLTGRRFGPGDLASSAMPIIVNRTFVSQVLGDGHALGRWVRYIGRASSLSLESAAPETWYEIVGVVGDLPVNPIAPGETEARVYHPLATERMYPASLAVRMRADDPQSFAERLRAVTTALDPRLRLTAVLPLTEVYHQEQMGLHWGAVAFAIVASSVLLVSAAGIYALMSFTVTRRRKEIGIRAALGAHPRRVLQGIFSRVLRQLAIGVVLGGGVAALLDAGTDGELMGGHRVALLSIVSSIMLAVGLLAALGPARRGLRIQPTEALRE